MLFSICAHVVEDLPEGAAIEKILELRGAILRIRRGIGRLPLFVVIGLPLTLEVVFPSAARPEFRLLEINGFYALIERALHAGAQVAAIILAWRHIGNHRIAAVNDVFAVHVSLRLIPMIGAVEFAVEVVLVAAPGHAGHEIDDVAVVAPGGHKSRHFGADAIHHGCIGIHIDARRPWIAALEGKAILSAALGEFGVALRLGNNE